MKRVALVVEYDGTEFGGSQIQENARTVQQHLELRCRGVLTKDKPMQMRLASRTDAGVHATHQVASCNLSADMSSDQIREYMNSELPKDIAVREVRLVNRDFDPLRDAISRTYCYRINVGPSRSAFRHRTEWRVRRHLDIEAMAEGARLFVGTRDFASFAAVDRNDNPRPTTRRIDEVSVETLQNGIERLVTITVRGKSYVRQQVRRMVGMLVEIGTGKADRSSIVDLLEHPRVGAFSRPLPACGLTLTHIEYPPGTFDPPLAHSAHLSQLLVN